MRVYYIAKASSGAFKSLEDHYVKLIGSFSKVELKPIFNSQIEKSQKISQESAQSSYTKAFDGVQGYKVALHERGKLLDSYQFAELLENHPHINFFIGGAYGLEESFVDGCNFALSLSPLTLSHDLARAVLLEQIYRGLTINNNHPYHK